MTRHGKSIVVVALLALLTALSAVPAGASSKAVLGSFGTTSGGAGGQVSTGTGVAVNTTGAGGVGIDEVYVADRGNNRVDQFTSAGDFVRAWGINVVRTGPGNSTANSEEQTVTVKAGGGTFTLSLNFNGSTQTTTPIPYNAGASSVEAALQALSNVGPIGGTIAVTGGPGDATGSAPYTLDFGGALAGTDVAQVTPDFTGLAQPLGTLLTCSTTTTATTKSFQWLANGDPIAGATANTYTTVAADAGKAIQCQMIALNAASGATQISSPNTASIVTPAPGTLPPRTAQSTIATPTGTVDSGQELTCNAGAWTNSPTSYTYQWYRNGLALGSPTTSAATSSKYTITPADIATAAVFQCKVTATNAGGSTALISGNKNTTAGKPSAPASPPSANATMTAPTSSVATTTPGVAAFEICVAANGDVCQAGSAGAIAGAVDSPEAIAVDPETGNVFVASANRRIDVFSAKGAFEGAFGWKVNATTPESKLQLCTTATGCQAGGEQVSTAVGTSVSAGPAGGLSSLSQAALAVDPGSGNLYVGERGNLRVNEFSFALNGSDEVTGVAFLRAFGGDLISGGAKGTGNLTSGKNEVGSVVMSEKAFAIGQEISGVGIPAGTFIVGINPTLSLVNLVLSQPATASGTGVTLTAATGAGNVPRNETQLITLSATGTFALKFETRFPTASPTTAAIDSSAPAKESEGPGSVEAALKALANIGAGNVEVSGPPGGPYAVEFKGARYADTNVPQLIAAAGSMPASAVTVTTATEGTSPELCTAATGCQAGSAGAEGGFFPSNTPTGLAVDSGGFIYAATAEGTCSAANPCRVQKFNPDGSFKEAFGPSSGGGAECQLTWSAGAANTEAAVGVAVDPSNQHVFVTRKATAGSFELCELDSEGFLKDRSPVAPKPTNATGYLSPAVASSGNVYVNAPISGAQGAIYVFGPVPPASAEIASADEIGQTTARLNGKVTVPSLEGEGFETTYRFEYSGDNGLTWARAPFADASVGSTPGTYAVSQKITGLQPNLTYRFRLIAITGAATSSPEATFTTLGAKPTITKTIAMPIGGDSAKLTGAVNPNNSPTTYHFEWGTSAAYGNEIPDFDAFTGAGGQPVAVGSTIKGLQLSTTYHFRIVATNASGTAFGPDTTFTTNNFPGVCPNEEIRDQQGSQYLPDCRAFEQVSPAEKRPVASVRAFKTVQLTYQASRDGSKIYYPLLFGLEDATAGGNVGYLASRNPAGWLSTQLSPPALTQSVANGFGENFTGRIIYNSPSLSCTVIESNQPLTADTPGPGPDGIQAQNLYRVDAAGSYTLLTAMTPSNPEISLGPGNRYKVDWATPDCSHVLFESDYRFLPNAPSDGQILYEWAEGDLRLAGIRPDGSVAPDAVPGGGSSLQFGTTINSISTDGSRVFFTATSNEGIDNGKTAIFVSEDGAPAVNISRSPDSAKTGVRLEQVTPGGTHVFFLAKYGLTPSSSKGPASCELAGNAENKPNAGEGCDLYDYNVDTETLTDLSADTNPADVKGAGVIGVLDASEDGSHVYFAARGQLIPGKGNTEAQNLAGIGAFNIYLNHDGELSFVGVMTARQTSANGQGANLASDFDTWAADATPDGDRLLFLSKANVTGYPASGVNQVYLYSAAADTTVCISCRPDGLPSVGTSITAPISFKLSPGWSTTNRLSHRPRAISDDGNRVFFTMPDILAPGAVSGVKNLYQWEAGRVYLLVPGNGGSPDQEILYADASAAGDDVFFRSKSQLVPQDFDTTQDLFNIRVGGGFAAPDPPPPPCNPAADECQGPPTPQPQSPSPASAGFSGPGNPPPPATKKSAQKKKKKRAKGRRRKHREQSHKRQAKQRGANNKGRAAR